jgi:hypothetical protein
MKNLFIIFLGLIMIKKFTFFRIENFEKILHRDSENNFNHHIIYSDDESASVEADCVKKVSFGNLDITVSKKTETEDINEFKFKTRASGILIDKDEYSSDEDKEVPIESFVKTFSQEKSYTPKIVSECKTELNVAKKINVFTTTKEQVKECTEWPETCNVCCWWCCHTFEGTPCTLPIKYDSHRKRFTFVGLFCSWNCVKAYNADRNSHQRHECTSLISLLIQQLHGITKSVNIKAAPPRQTLKMFGGYLDIDEFRGPRGVDEYKMNLIMFNYIYPQITEITHVKQKCEKKNLRLSRPVN